VAGFGPITARATVVSVRNKRCPAAKGCFLKYRVNGAIHAQVRGDRFGDATSAAMSSGDCHKSLLSKRSSVGTGGRLSEPGRGQPEHGYRTHPGVARYPEGPGADQKPKAIAWQTAVGARSRAPSLRIRPITSTDQALTFFVDHQDWCGLDGVFSFRWLACLYAHLDHLHPKDTGRGSRSPVPNGPPCVGVSAELRVTGRRKVPAAR
jgi:hypothetical protein